MMKKYINNSFKFIDLFAGIGAFHIALTELGGECVFASEIDKNAIQVYKENFHMDSNHDMFKIRPQDIPKHDVLCAGFPCQPFSYAGKKKGFTDTRGTLFFEIERILEYHHTPYIILENVKHLVKHDNGNTYKTIIEHLKNLGYILSEIPIILSPHQLGVPQNRERIFIIGIHKNFTNLSSLKFNFPQNIPIKSIYDILEKNQEKINEKYKISAEEEKVFNTWEKFKKEFSSFPHPVLIEEFGQNYDVSSFPKWKQQYCEKNRKFYEENKEKIDEWMKENNVENFKKRDKKFEWQAGNKYNSVFDTLIQLRQSGIRCKKPETFPALVAIVQTSIVAKYKRRITPREAARLQSFPEWFKLSENDAIAYKQLGNSANIEVVKYVAKQLFSQNDKDA